MKSRVTVRLRGEVGLEDIEDLGKQLARETKFDWHEEPLPDEKHLAVVETILVAMVAGVLTKRVDQVIDRVIKRWQDQWHDDPPGAEVATEELPDAPEDNGSGDTGGSGETS
ncbi:MAG: hypothetical protein J2P25_17995 [Nocardiopsaceae bacterium]|nr:hypothetical protein [Nocardiopsaceae bacterium]